MECLKAKAVKQHRRRQTKQEVATIVADFLFIGPSKRKALVVVEVVSRMLAAVPVHENVERTRAIMRQWFAEFALDGIGHKCAVEVFTDAEVAVGNLLKAVETGTRLSVRKAPPQAHEVVGLAERYVRYVEETVGLLKSDLRQAFQVELVDTTVAWELVLQYVSCTYNRFGAPNEQKMAPLEIMMGKGLPETKSTLIGCTVLAELPDSVASDTRWEEAAYLGHALNSLGHRVSIILKGEPHVFTARSIKLLVPLRLKPELAPMLFKGGGSEHESRPSTEQTVYEPPKLSGNPPAAWYEEHGRTAGCLACDRGFKGHVHSKACKERYSRWYALHHKEVLEGEEASSVHVPLSRDDPLVSRRITGKSTPAVAADVPKIGPEEMEVGIPVSEDTKSPLSLPNATDFVPVGPMPGEETCSKTAETAELPVREDDTVMLEVEVQPSDPEALEGKNEDPVEGSMEVDSLLVAYNLGQANLDVESAKFFVHRLSCCYAVFFSPSPETTRFELCGRTILIAEPKYCVADSNGMQLCQKKTFEGMLTELRALNEFKAGKPLSSSELHEHKRQGTRVIPTRWVLNPKPASDDPEKVRSRLVVKEIVKQGDQTARQLAISSPTVHLETFRTLIAYAAKHDLCLLSMDVSTAFMASELEPKHQVVVQMPPGCCNEDGSRVHMLLYKALNGLRVAGLAWSNKLDRVVSALGLKAGSLECNLYTGMYKNEWILFLAYVDDFLVVCRKESVGRAVLKELQKKLKVRHTGTLLPSTEGSSRIEFLGRVLERFAGDCAIYLSMPDDYLKPCFDAFQLSKSTAAVPGIDKILEETSPESNSPLSPEAATRYRSVLGRLAWFAQVRGDLSIFIMLLSTGQSCPLSKHEKALRAVLRFLRSCEHLALRFPSAAQDADIPVTAFTDASWAPLEYLKRRSISGGYIFAFGSLVKHWSRVQQIVATSSCESEIAAIAVMVAEISCVQDVAVHLCGSQVPTPEVHTDAQSARIVLLSKGETRQSRHFSIKCHLIRQKLADDEVSLKWRPGVQLLADMGTKVLPTSKYLVFRSQCGYVELKTSFMHALLTAMPTKFG